MTHAKGKQRQRGHLTHPAVRLCDFVLNRLFDIEHNAAAGQPSGAASGLPGRALVRQRTDLVRKPAKIAFVVRRNMKVRKGMGAMGGGTNARAWHKETIPGIAPRLSPFSSTACRPLSGIHYQEQSISMNKDQVEGRVKEVKGKIKEVAGNLVGNETMEAWGKIQKTGGQAQAKFGDVKKDLKDARKSS